MEKQMMKKLLAFVCMAGMSVSALAASDKDTIDKRLANATSTLNEIMGTPDKSIPNSILQQATCVGVIRVW